LSWAQNGARQQDLLIDWPAVAMWLFAFEFERFRQESEIHYLKEFRRQLNSWVFSCEVLTRLDPLPSNA
jgi:hypothetical protein